MILVFSERELPQSLWGQDSRTLPMNHKGNQERSGASEELTRLGVQLRSWIWLNVCAVLVPGGTAGTLQFHLATCENQQREQTGL